MLYRITLLIACLLITFRTAARLEYPRTFTERALSRISTPSLTPGRAQKMQTNAAQVVSLADAVQLPAKDPWQRTAPTRRPPHPSSATTSTVFLILGPVLLLAGLAIFLVGDAHTNNGDWLNNTFNQVFVKVAGIFLMIAGGVFAVIGGAMKLSAGGGTENEAAR